MISTPTKSRGTTTQGATSRTITPKSGKRSRRNKNESSDGGTPAKTSRGDAPSSTSVAPNLPVDPMTAIVMEANKAAFGAVVNPPAPENVDANQPPIGDGVEDQPQPPAENVEDDRPPGEEGVDDQQPAENVAAAENVVQGNHPGYLDKLKIFLNNQKRFTAPESLLPTEILLSKIKNEVSSHICRTWKEVKAKRSYTGLLFLDKSSTGTDILSKQIIPDCLKNIFPVPAMLHVINFSEALYHNQVNKIVEAIDKAISNTDHQPSIGGQTVVFFERIDVLWESISWDAKGRVQVAAALKTLLLHPIIVLATSGKHLDEINEHYELKLLFLNRTIDIGQPDDHAKIRVFMQIFIKHAAFRKALGSYRDAEDGNPITEYKKENLGACFGEPFKLFMEDILRMCQEKPLLYILTMYDYLYDIVVKNQQVDKEQAVTEITDDFIKGMEEADMKGRLELFNV